MWILRGLYIGRAIALYGLYEFGKTCYTFLNDTNTTAPEYDPKNPYDYTNQKNKFNEHFNNTLEHAKEVGKSGLENGISKPYGGVPHGN